VARHKVRHRQAAMSSALAAQRHEAAELVELMRRQGVHQALNQARRQPAPPPHPAPDARPSRAGDTQAILQVYVSGTNAPSEMLECVRPLFVGPLPAEHAC
jgi:hypothetical protein